MRKVNQWKLTQMLKSAYKEIKIVFITALYMLKKLSRNRKSVKRPKMNFQRRKLQCVR